MGLSPARGSAAKRAAVAAPPAEPSAPVPVRITRVAGFRTGRGIPHRRGFGYSGCDAPEAIAVAWRVFTYHVCRSFRTPGSPLANSDVILFPAVHREGLR